MAPTLVDLIERGQQLKCAGLFYEYRSFYDWHEDCCEYLERILLGFRERAQSPADIDKAVDWLKGTFQQNAPVS